jgi:hypothetical protein
MSPRLSRMYWGEIIYATPGSGKTYVCNKYRDVIDADDLIVEAAKEILPNLILNGYDDPRIAISQIFRYIHFRKSEMDRIYDLAVDKMMFHKQRNDVILLGTKDLMHIADRIFIQQDSDIVRDGFNTTSETYALNNIDRDEKNIHYIDGYLDGCLQKLCAGRLY